MQAWFENPLVTFGITLFGIAVIAFGIAYAWFKQSSRIGGLAAVCDALFHGYMGILGALQESGTVKPAVLMKALTDFTQQQTQKTLDNLGGTNPISVDEVARLRSYLERMQKGESLSPEEAEDMQQLSQRVVKEKPDDPGSWMLVLIGVTAAILLGVLGVLALDALLNNKE